MLIPIIVSIDIKLKPFVHEAYHHRCVLFPACSNSCTLFESSNEKDILLDDYTLHQRQEKVLGSSLYSHKN